MILSDYPHLASISNDPSAKISDRVHVTIKCSCGTEVTVGTRSLVRKWGDKPGYLCKSCHVKTYANDPNRVEKFKKSFAAAASTAEYRAKASANGKAVWADPVLRARITEAVRQDNIINPKKAASRAIANKALMAKAWYKDHMLKMRAMQDGKRSILELIVERVLRDESIPFVSQFQLGYYNFDFKIDAPLPFLLEIQGEYWHKDSCGKDSAKATYASNQGHVIHHLWESEFAAIGKVRETILTWCGKIDTKQIDFQFSDIAIAEIPTIEARKFLGSYHYLPAVSKSGYHIGGFHNGLLVASATFSTVSNQGKRSGYLANTRELSRFCIHPKFHKHNFASWFLTRAVRLFCNKYSNITDLVSFADTTYGHSGTIYQASNWKYVGETKEDYSYVSGDGYLAHKKTVWDRAKKNGITEAEYAAQHGYQKSKSLPKKKFTLSLR